MKNYVFLFMLWPSIISAQDSYTGQISKQYYNKIKTRLDELRHRSSYIKNRSGLYENTARSIDNLPILGVDQDLREFSLRVSKSLRYQAQINRESKVRAYTRQAENHVAYDGYYYYYSPRRVYTIDIAIGAEENLDTKTIIFTKYRQIEDELADIRQKLTIKYNIEF